MVREGHGLRRDSVRSDSGEGRAGVLELREGVLVEKVWRQVFLAGRGHGERWSTGSRQGSEFAAPQAIRVASAAAR